MQQHSWVKRHTETDRKDTQRQTDMHEEQTEGQGDVQDMTNQK